MRSLIIVAALAALPARAAAQPSLVSPDPPAVAEEREWYGYWTLAADAGALLVGASTENFGVGIGGYVLGGPMIHVWKENYAGAALSAAARIGLPLALGYWGHLDDEDAMTGSGHVDEQSYGISGAAAGVILGVMAASLLDAIVIARRTVVVEPPPSWSLHVTTSNGVAVGLGGRW